MSAQQVKITSSQRQYLIDTDFLPRNLAQIIETAQPASGCHWSLAISRDIAEEFRDAFTGQLAAAGFDASYSPNDEGTMLEDLVDRFFQP